VTKRVVAVALGVVALGAALAACEPRRSCSDESCDQPPASYCADGSHLYVYEGQGACGAGECVYEGAEYPCPDGCVAGECLGNPCAGIVCDDPPADECVGAQTLRQYEAAGTCSDGDCAYGSTDVACADGCVNDQCAGCTPDCAGAQCGPDGCGGQCGLCGPTESCDAGQCVEACTGGCGAGEACVGFACAPLAVLLASEGAAAPSLWCPPGYQEVGHWRPGPGTTDGAVEGRDYQGLRIDAGWVWVCSADPTRVRVVVTADDCGAVSTPCAGTLRGSWHVGDGCGAAPDHGVDAAGVALQAGWLGLCVAAGADVKVETGGNDCGAAGPGCGAWREAGAWHTDPGSCGVDLGVGDSGAAIGAGWLNLCADSAAYPPVDPATLQGKVMAGYQGWFGAPGDGSVSNSWRHWFRSQTPVAADATFDLWPDLSELDPDERFATSMTIGGAPAALFSAYNAKTVARHLRWMAAYGIDGAFLQRFLSETAPGSAGQELRDQVTLNVMAGAESHGRTFAIMYDISGAAGATLVADLTADWEHLVDDLGVTASRRYQQHDGLPLVAIWGLGFTDRPGTVADALALQDYFCCSAAAPYRAAVMGGVPTHWRTGTGDSQPGFDTVYRSFDIISPWSVGRYADNAGVDAFNADQIQPDLTEAAAHGRGYLPVVWPGFSWANLMQDPGVFNQIPRHGGAFFWKQVSAALASGATMLYVAMFDEVDEGTAIFKAAATQAAVPDQGQFLSLDADGQAVPTDWYLRLAGAGAKTTAGQTPWSASLPQP
jgi:hypothetical protein